MSELQKLLDLKGYSPPVIEEILQSVLTLQSFAASKGEKGRKISPTGCRALSFYSNRSNGD